MKLTEMGQEENSLPVCLAGWRGSLPTAGYRVQGKISFGVLKYSMRCFQLFMGLDETYGMLRGRTKGGEKEGSRCIRCRKIEGKALKEATACKQAASRYVGWLWPAFDQHNLSYLLINPASNYILCGRALRTEWACVHMNTRPFAKAS